MIVLEIEVKTPLLPDQRLNQKHHFYQIRKAPPSSAHRQQLPTKTTTETKSKNVRSSFAKNKVFADFSSIGIVQAIWRRAWASIIQRISADKRPRADNKCSKTHAEIQENYVKMKALKRRESIVSGASKTWRVKKLHT